MNPKQENQPIDETLTCFYCEKEKLESQFTPKGKFTGYFIDMRVCKACAKKAYEEGVVNVFKNKFFGSPTQEDADKTTEKVKNMSKKKRAKLTKKLQKMGYSEEQITEALEKIEKGVKL